MKSSKWNCGNNLFDVLNVNLIKRIRVNFMENSISLLFDWGKLLVCVYVLCCLKIELC